MYSSYINGDAKSIIRMMRLPSLIFLLLNAVMIHSVDGQADCGTISLTYFQTGSTVSARLHFSRSMELSSYKWTHFFSGTKPNFDFPEAVKTDSSKYEYNYDDFDLIIKDLESSDDGMYNIECYLTTGYHIFSGNKIYIHKPYTVVERPESSTPDVTETTPRTTTSTSVTTSVRSRVTTRKSSIPPEEIIFFTTKTDQEQASQTSVAETIGTTRQTPTNDDIIPIAPVIGGVIGGCVLFVVVITIACTRKTCTKRKPDTDLLCQILSHTDFQVRTVDCKTPKCPNGHCFRHELVPDGEQQTRCYLNAAAENEEVSDGTHYCEVRELGPERETSVMTLQTFRPRVPPEVPSSDEASGEYVNVVRGESSGAYTSINYETGATIHGSSTKHTQRTSPYANADMKRVTKDWVVIRE